MNEYTVWIFGGSWSYLIGYFAKNKLGILTTRGEKDNYVGVSADDFTQLI